MYFHIFNIGKNIVLTFFIILIKVIKKNVIKYQCIYVMFKTTFYYAVMILGKRLILTS